MSALDFRPLCSDCWEAAHGGEPAMGDPCSTFAPGTCARCGTAAGIVFTLDPDLNPHPDPTTDTDTERDTR